MTGTPSSGVVLLHGLAKTPRSFGRMERALQKEGFATLNLAYLSRKHPLEVLVEDVHAAIQPFALQTDALYFVTQGMTDHIVLGATHSGLLRHQGAINQTISFLRDGRFSRP